MDRGGDAVRYTGFFSCREKKRLTLERVETGYTFKSPGLAFFSPFIGKLFSFFFLFSFSRWTPPHRAGLMS